jgi:hypothetical protein
VLSIVTRRGTGTAPIEGLSLSARLERKNRCGGKGVQTEKMNVKKENHSGVATSSIIRDLKAILVSEISAAR